MVIPKRQRIILKSKTAGNSEYGSNSSVIVVSEYISLPNLLAVLVFQTRVLADGMIIYFYRNDNDAPVIVILNCVLTRCVVNEVPTLIFEQVAIYPFPIVEALASEFYFSHRLQFL